MKAPDKEYLDICRQKVAALVKEKAEHDRRGFELNREIRNIKLFAIKEKWGIEVGDLVRTRNGKVYRISSIDLRFSNDIESVLGDIPWVRGTLQKADGGFSLVERRLFDDWVLVE